MFNLNLTPAIKQILIACIVFYLGDILLASRGINLTNILGLHYLRSEDFGIWQPITSMFMHNSFPHIAMNMFALITFGSILENVLGTKKFLILYFVSGLGSFALHELMDAWRMYHLTGIWFPGYNDLKIVLEGDRLFFNPGQYSEKQATEAMGIYLSTAAGASGALYGITVAFAFLFPNTQLSFMFIPYPIKAKFLIPIILGLDLYLGLSRFSWDPIAHFAHLGGGITGFLIVYYWRRFNKRTFW